MKVVAIQCPKCLTIIYSRARHDFHHCRCGEVSIDGGFDYRKISFRDEFPDELEIDVNATSAQLFQDWNNGEDKFGWIHPSIRSKRKEKRKMNRKVTPLLQEHSKRKAIKKQRKTK